MVGRAQVPRDLCRVTYRSITPKVHRVITYLDQHYSTPAIAVKYVASLVSTNPDYLSRKFRKETGLRLHDYLLRKRVQTSVALLRDPAKSIKEISGEVGFSCSESLEVFSH